MKYTKFIIKNYKAINYLEVNMGNNIMPLIGVNESGKTSILQAILAFDKDKDNLLDGYHVDPKNRYLTKQENCDLVACLCIESKEEYEEIGEQISLNMDNSLYSWLKGKYENQQPIELKRNYENNKFQKTYEIINEPVEILSNPKIQQLIKALTKKLPTILYFDDFSDRVPEEVVFFENYCDDGKLSRGKAREWQEIIQEVFDRALIDEELDLKKFLKLENEDDRGNFLSDVNKKLNSEIITEWKRLKATYTELQSEGNDNLSVKIEYIPNNGTHKFKFKVIDSERNDRDRIFDINTRSKGFQWFFNFIIKLRFNPKYKENPRNAIFLLDEPGSYLHSSAQVGLLKVLKDIAENNIIIYCTHSQYLLDPDIINISSIKIVSKSDGAINLKKYGDSGITESLGAFSALNDALHLKFGFNEQILKKVILTEGITDYYFYKMFLCIDDINYIPGVGCSQLRELISILISCSDAFLVILDNDTAGRKAYQKYSKFFQDSFEKNSYQYQDLCKSDYELEDIISDEYKEMILKHTGCKNIKNSLVELYFDENKSEIINKIDKKTQTSLDILKRKIMDNFN